VTSYREVENISLTLGHSASLRDLRASIRFDRRQHILLPMADWLCSIPEPICAHCISILGGYWRLRMSYNWRRCHRRPLSRRWSRPSHSNLHHGASFRPSRGPYMRRLCSPTNRVALDFLDPLDRRIRCHHWHRVPKPGNKPTSPYRSESQAPPKRAEPYRPPQLLRTRWPCAQPYAHHAEWYSASFENALLLPHRLPALPLHGRHLWAPLPALHNHHRSVHFNLPLGARALRTCLHRSRSRFLRWSAGCKQNF
jgi:hypothetical protein